MIVDDEEAANLLNDYFSSVFTVEDCSFTPDASVVFDRYILGEGLSEIEITADMVETKLSKMKYK